MRAYKIIKIILILIPIIILAVLVYKDFNPSGYLKVGYDFCREEPFISKFSPLGRVLAVERINGACSQKMVIDPVYFDVRLPQKFNTARVKLWYQKNSQTPLKIGPAVDLSAWQWQLKDINYIRDDGDWQVGVASYDLFLSSMDGNRLRFLVSSPKLTDSGQEVIFKKIAIEFMRPPLSQTNWRQKVRDWLVSFRINL